MKFKSFFKIKRLMHILALPVIIAGNSLIYADNHSEDNIIERIQIESKGNVIIDIPENIRTLILHSNPKEQTTEIKPGVNKLAGFRIQVFSDGRNQHTLEARAKARGSAILAKFPKYKGQVYTYSSSPNWYTRVGNFKNEFRSKCSSYRIEESIPKLFLRNEGC